MGNRFGFRLLLGIALVGALAVVGVYTYNLGLAHGIAESGQLVAAPGSGAPVVIWPWPWGFGFGFFPFFFVLLCFFLLRRAFWGGPRWGWHHYRDGVPPRFEEWHRRAHERDASPAAPGAATD